LINKFDQTLFADSLRRLNPQIVVVAFGTNEAANEDLDPDRYRRNFEKAINKIQLALPDAVLVLIGPADGAERASHCTKPSLEAACHSLPREETSAGGAALAGTTPPDGAKVPSKRDECDWRPLPKLEVVRTIERNIAEQRGFTFWNWASIMPTKCGAHIWATANPPLMMPDHVHFSIAGYNKGAEQFLAVLIPVIEKLQVRPNITAHN
jgi:lysophospholipase L1-like esterase